MTSLLAPGRIGRIGQGRRSGSGSGSSTNLKHAVIYGQSLALGTDPDGASIITTSPVTGHFQFNGGIRPVYDRTGETNVNTTIYPGQITSLVTLQEANSATDPTIIRESFASGMALRMTSAGMFSSTARGAFTIANLSRTAANHFPNTVTAVLAAKDLCDAAGYGYEVGAVIWKHGEADAAAGTTRSAYKSSLTTLRQDLENYFDVAALGSVGTLKMLIDQQAMSASTGTWAEIAVAAIELHRAGGGFYCAGPTYHLIFTGANDVHLTSISTRNYGEKLGLIYQRLLNGQGWNPCHITGTPTRVGSTITVPIHVPVPPLTVDTTLVASAANRGFSYSGANITSVTITDDGTGDNAGVITIELDAAAGGTLRVAYNNYVTDGYIGPTFGSRSNIRDSDPAVTLYDGTPLYNWLCNDQWVVA
jgi:hypothetical protein